MFMNQMDIESAANAKHACPNVKKGLQLLQALVHSVNEQSDGWAYWPAPSNSCRKLFDLLRTAGNLMHGTTGTITDADLKKAISPIRSMVTREKLKQAKFGNVFNFDVDAALVTQPTEPEVTKSKPVRLKVVTVSTNQNSFGLKNMIMISDHGQGWQAAANDINIKPVDTILVVPADVDISTFLTRQGFEIPQRFLQDPDKKLMKQVWGDKRAK